MTVSPSLSLSLSLFLFSLIIVSILCIVNKIVSVPIRIVILQRCSNLQKSNINKTKTKQQQDFIHLSLYFNSHIHMHSSPFDRLVMLFPLLFFSWFSGSCKINECALPSSEKIERIKYLRSISSVTKVCLKFSMLDFDCMCCYF